MQVRARRETDQTTIRRRDFLIGSLSGDPQHMIGVGIGSCRSEDEEEEDQEKAEAMHCLPAADGGGVDRSSDCRMASSVGPAAAPARMA